MSKPNVLFLADTTHHTQAVQDHIGAITGSSDFNWCVLNPITCKTIDKLDLSMFAAIGVHYSIKCYNDYYLSRSLQQKLREFRGNKFLFLQDEYQKVNQMQEFLANLGFDILFTLVSPAMVDKAYPDPRLSSLKKVTVLTGYVHPNMKKIESKPIAERTIDVSYRGRPCPYWLGKLAYEKIWIGNEFERRARRTDLRLDISLSEVDRVYGDDWYRLLGNAKAVLGTESGASIWDFDGEVVRNVNQYLRQHKDASFEELERDVLRPFDGNIMYNAVSPRVFEAAATKTPMVMFPGEYSGVCQPDKHYIVLAKDFSNFDEVVAKLKDDTFLQDLADRTYHDLILSDQYAECYLADTVSHALQHEIMHASNAAPVNQVNEKIIAVMHQHKFLNLWRCFYTEARFISRNFLDILFDPKYSLWERIKNLTKGVKRYVAYFIPRITG